MYDTYALFHCQRPMFYFKKNDKRGPYKFHRKTIVRIELVFVHKKIKIHQLKVERMPCFQLVYVTTSPCVCRG